MLGLVARGPANRLAEGLLQPLGSLLAPEKCGFVVRVRRPEGRQRHLGEPRSNAPRRTPIVANYDTNHTGPGVPVKRNQKSLEVELALRQGLKVRARVPRPW